MLDRQISYIESTDGAENVDEVGDVVDDTDDSSNTDILSDTDDVGGTDELAVDRHKRQRVLGPDGGDESSGWGSSTSPPISSYHFVDSDSSLEGKRCVLFFFKFLVFSQKECSLFKNHAKKWHL